MRSRLRTAGLAVFAVFAVIVLGLFVAIERGWARTFSAPFPAIAASTDPAVIERGRYLVYGPAACAYCHVPRDQWPRLDRGEALPLSGGHVFPLPFGGIYSANITPDTATGIGRRTDGEVARILRYALRADGHAAVPLMEFAGLSDDDLTAVISFLRSQPPVANAVPAHELTTMGKVLMAVVIAPEPPHAAPHSSPSTISAARGEYLATKVSSCVACHTDRDSHGTLVGPPFAGGQRMDVAADAAVVYVTPNLTPDPATSVIGRWTEEVFVRRFRQGAQVDGTPMPWGAYGRMTDDDLRSVYRYLRSLPPVSHDTGPKVQRRS